MEVKHQNLIVLLESQMAVKKRENGGTSPAVTQWRMRGYAVAGRSTRCAVAGHILVAPHSLNAEVPMN
jgi:hypothetical protein